MKAVFMGSPALSVPFLDFLIKKNVELIVFTQKDKVRCRGKNCDATPVKKHAILNNIPVFECSAKSSEAFEIISNFNPDYFFVVAYGQILPEKLLNIPRFAPINVHFSLLPKYRGATPVNTALLNGDKVTGTTIMFMDKGLDTGNIIYQKEIAVDESDNATTLFEKLIKLSLEVIEENWKEIESGIFSSVPQNGDAVITKLISKDDLIINWNESARHIFNKIRAFNFEPGIKTYFRGKLLFVEKAKLLSEEEKLEYNPGTIVKVCKNSFAVACRNGVIEIETVKPEGKKSMPCCAFVAGYHPQLGEILGENKNNG